MEHETRKNKWKPRNLYTSNLYRFKIILGRVFHIPKALELFLFVKLIVDFHHRVG